MIWELHGQAKPVGPEFTPGNTLELDTGGLITSVYRTPRSDLYPKSPVDQVQGITGGAGAIKAYAFWDHQHPLPADMGGASALTAGTRGLVSAPQPGDHLKFWKGDGTWADPQVPSPSTTIPLAPIDGGQIGIITGQYALPDHRHPLEPVFTGAGPGSAGTRGAVPPPPSGGNTYWLKGSGGWSPISYLDLADTPTSYVGKAWYIVRVKLDETGLEYHNAILPTNAQNIPPKPFDDIGAIGGSAFRYALEDHRHPLPDVMVGAGIGTAGTKGLVPAPDAGQFNRFLSGSGAWRGEFSTLYPGLCPKVTAQNIADNAVLLASGFWGGIGFTDLHDTPNTIDNRLAFVRVKFDLTGLEYFLPYSGQVGLPVSGEFLQPSSGAASGTSPYFARVDHAHDFTVFAGPGTTGGVGAVPASTTDDVTNNRVLHADGTWKVPTAGGGGGTSGIPENTFTAKGDILVGTGSGTYGVLSAATNGWHLVLDSTATLGVRWQSFSLPTPGSDIQPLGTLAAGVSSLYAREDHVHSLPATYTGATAVTPGVIGLMPAANAGQQSYYLTGGGTYVAPPSVYGGPGTSGFVPDPGSGNTNLWLKSTGWTALSWLLLSDTPSDYDESTNKVVYSTGNGLAFKSIDPATSAPLAGVPSAEVGDSLKYARENHTHPLDPVFTQGVRGSVPPPINTPISGQPKFLSDGQQWIGRFSTTSDGLVPKTGTLVNPETWVLAADQTWKQVNLSDSFKGLADTPSSYSGQNGKILVVNETGGGQFGGEITFKNAVPAESLTLGESSFLSKNAVLTVNNDFYTQSSGGNNIPVWQNLIIPGTPDTDVLCYKNVAAGTYLAIGRVIVLIYSSSTDTFLVQSRVAQLNTFGVAENSGTPSPVTFTYEEMEGAQISLSDIPYLIIKQMFICDRVIVPTSSNEVRIQIHVGRLEAGQGGGIDAESPYDIDGNSVSPLQIGGGAGGFGGVPGLNTLEGSTLQLLKVG